MYSIVEELHQGVLPAYLQKCFYSAIRSMLGPIILAGCALSFQEIPQPMTLRQGRNIVGEVEILILIIIRYR